ncbi:MAG: hypothetical protein ACPGJS_09310 [Flammeovirgaceae bacterium]
MTLLGFLITLLILSLGKMFLSRENTSWKSNKNRHVALNNVKDFDEGNAPQKHDWVSVNS